MLTCVKEFQAYIDWNDVSAIYRATSETVVLIFKSGTEKTFPLTETEFKEYIVPCVEKFNLKGSMLE